MLRGIAILGILPVNAAFFAYPAMVAEQPGYPGGAGGEFAWGAMRLLAEYKFITLFAFLFGVGMAIVYGRAQEKLSGYGSVMVRRLFALWLFGVLHATLLWYGDIVAYYAPLGLMTFWAVSFRPKVLAGVGSVLIALPVVVVGLLALGGVIDPDGAMRLLGDFLDVAERDGVGGAAATGTFAEFSAGLDRVDPDFEAAVYAEGSWGRIALVRIVVWVSGAVYALPYFGPRLIGLFLLGMACVRSGWLMRPESPGTQRIFRGLVFGALPIGLAIEATSLALTLGPNTVAYASGAEALHLVGSILMSAGYLGVVGLLVTRAPDARWMAPFEAAGRTTFSVYIGQSLIMSTLFYSYGFGLFDSVGRPALMGIVAAVWVGQLALATWWLRQFRTGPIEWLWRSLTYLRWQPFRRMPE